MSKLNCRDGAHPLHKLGDARKRFDMLVLP
jgi:hypothetical protein